MRAAGVGELRSAGSDDDVGVGAELRRRAGGAVLRRLQLAERSWCSKGEATRKSA